jgi:hypothetical protein
VNYLENRKAAEELYASQLFFCSLRLKSQKIFRLDKYVVSSIREGCRKAAHSVHLISPKFFRLAVF